MSVAEQSTVLSSWKDIARYLGKGVRTVQRWERHLGLPVRRPVGASQKSAVLLNREDVDTWLATRFAARDVEIAVPDRVGDGSDSVRAALRENMETARQLRDTHIALTQQIAESIRVLNERFDILTTQSTQSPWSSATFADPALLSTARAAVSEQIA